VRRPLVLWLVLFAAYASTIGAPSLPGARYGPGEARALAAATSLLDGALVVRHGSGIGLPVLLAPAAALGGPRLAELWVAALAALGWVLAAALARRLVPEPWATAGPLVCGLSVPALAGAAVLSPSAVAGTFVAGGAVLALRARSRPTVRAAALAALPAALLPWLDPAFALAAAAVALSLVRWLLRRGRQLAALVAGEVVLTSAVAYVTVNQRLYGWPLPPEMRLPALDVLERLPLLVGSSLDRGAGLLRWAPVFALAGLAAWLLWRSHRERLNLAVPERVDVEVTATLLVAVGAAQVVAAAVLAPGLAGLGRTLLPAAPCLAALAAWGLRHAPRTGAALAALTLLASAWVWAAVRLGDAAWSRVPTEPPWFGLERILPRFAAGGWAPAALAAAVLLALAGLAARERHRRRRVPGLSWSR
jgi:hypothetical protein